MYSHGGTNSGSILIKGLFEFEGSITSGLSGFEQETQPDNYIFVDPPSFLGECKVMLYMSLKMALSLIFEVSPISINVIFIGRLPNAAFLLAGTGLGSAFSNVAGFSVAWGATIALWTLIPQAVGGSHHPNTRRHLLALYFQRGTIITMGLCVILTPILCFGGNIMMLFGQNPELLNITNEYCRAVVPYMYFVAFLSLCQRVGQSLNMNTELLVVVFIPFLLIAPLDYFFIFMLDMGWIGICYSLNIGMFLNMFLAILLLYYKGYGYIFKPLPISVVCTKRGIYEYFALAIPGAIQGCISWWIGEIMIIFSGLIVVDTNVAMSSTSIMYQMFVVFFFIVQGISYALNIRLGKYIGQASMQKSIRVLKISFLLLVIFLGVIVFLLAVFHSEIFGIFTEDVDIIAVINSVIFLMALRIIIYGVFLVLSGMYLAMGAQKYLAYVMIFGNWFVGIGIQLIAMYAPVFNMADNTVLGVQSVWFSSGFGFLVDNILLAVVFYYRLSLEQVMTVSKKRIIANVKHYGAISNKDKLEKITDDI